MTRRIVVTGARGQLGRQLVIAFEREGDTVIGLDHTGLELGDPDAPQQLVRLEADVIVNSAAWTDVDGCARDPQRATELNGVAPGRLAAAAAVGGTSFVQISTNEVFNGERGEPYDEEATPTPINPYGASKLAAERLVASATPEHLIVRTAWIFGPGGTNFPTRILAAGLGALERGVPLRVVADEHGNPTWAPDLARSIVAAVRSGVRGVLHLAGEPATSRHEWARTILEGLPDLRVLPITRAEFARSSTAPARAVLATERAASIGIPPIRWQTPSREYAATVLDELRVGR